MMLRTGGVDGPQRRLLRLAVQISERFGHERSCKFSSEGPSDERHLVCLARRGLRVDCDELLARLEHGFGWPTSYNDAVRALWAAASHVHLGLEAGSAREVWKLYLESATARLEPLAPPDPDWGAVHRAFKWEVRSDGGEVRSDGADSGKIARTDYDGLLRPGFEPRRQVLEQVLGRLPPLLVGMLRLISRAGGPNLMLLRVTDRGTDRASIDLNLYPLGLRVGDLRDELIRFAVAVGADPALAVRWIDGVAAQTLGHVAAGFDASGRAFATVYHGIHDCDGSCL